MRFILIRGKDCKHSVVYELSKGTDPKLAGARSIYVQRSAFPEGMPSVIEVEITASQATPAIIEGTEMHRKFEKRSGQISHPVDLDKEPE